MGLGDSLELFPDLPPVEDDLPIGDGNTPAEDSGAPAASDAPAGGSDTPAENNTHAGDNTPAEEETGSSDTGSGEEGADAMQGILDSLRTELSQNDSSLEGLSRSLDSLMEYMLETDGMRLQSEAEALEESIALQAETFPFPDYTSWGYPISVEYTVYPWGAGYEMAVSQQYSTPEAFKADYDKNVRLCGSGGTLKDYYIRTIKDGGGALLYDYKAVALLEVPFDGWESWGYPISVEYTVYPWGAGYEMAVSQQYSTPEAFQQDYSKNVGLCGEGGTLKDYYIRTIKDGGGTLLYDYKAEQPEDPETPDIPADNETNAAVLEALRSIDARLETLETDFSTLSENTVAYNNDMRTFNETDNRLQAGQVITNIAVGFCIVVLLGYTVAHGFWQRMRVG